LDLPPLSANFDIFGNTFGYTLLDVLVGAEVRLVQQFVFNPELLVRLDASDGQSAMGAVGSTLNFDTFGGGETLVTPTFLLNNSFRNITSLVISPTFDLEALAAHLNVNLPQIANDLGIPDPNLSFGPLFETHQSIDFTVKIFDENWQIPFTPIVGEAFTVKIPEPTTLTLFGLGFVLFGVGAVRDRRRRRDQVAA
jgi:hypothetical protein